MYDVIEVGPFYGSACQLVISEEKTLLFDTGFGFCANKTLENIKNALGERQLDIIFVSHSHYDHAGGCSLIKKYYKDAKVYAGEYAAKIFAKDSAKKVMNEMDASAAQMRGEQPVFDAFDDIKIDVCVKDGDKIAFGADEFTVWDTPGHTKCSVALADLKNKVFFSSETLGVYAGEGIVFPCYLVNYEQTIMAIKRAINENFEFVQLPHGEFLKGKRAKRFLELSLIFNQNVYEIINEMFTAGKTEDDIKSWFKNTFYNNALKENMPQAAFDMNIGYTLKASYFSLRKEK